MLFYLLLSTVVTATNLTTNQTLAIDLGYAWINGWKPWVYWANTTECFDRFTNFTMNEIPAYEAYLADEAVPIYN